MPPDDDDSELSDLSDTPEMRRILETVSKLPPEKLQRLVNLVESAINPSDSEEPPEDGEQE